MDKYKKEIQRQNSITLKHPSSNTKTQVYHYNSETESGKKLSLELKFKQIQYHSQNCLLVIINNVSAAVQYESEKNSSEYKNRLLSSFSHEIRTPLNGAISPLVLCFHDANTPEIIKNKYLEIAILSLKRLEYQLNDIIDFSNMIQNKFAFTLNQANMRIMLKEIQHFLRPQMQFKENLNLHVQIDKYIPVFFKTDEQRVKQVLINVLSNAIKFSKVGNIYLNLELMKRKGKYKSIKIDVFDEGIGMNQEKLKKLNELLLNPLSAQVEMNSTGCSLGLAIAQSIAIQLNHIEKKGLQVQSTEGLGTHFFWIIDEMSQNNQNEQELEDTLSNTPKGNQRICIPQRSQTNSNPSISSKDKQDFPMKKLSAFSNADYFQDEIEEDQQQISQLSRELSFEIQNWQMNTFTENYCSNQIVYGSLNKNQNRIQVRQSCECKQIMVVDDDGFNLEVLKINLTKLNKKCVLANNGKEAIEILSTKQYLKSQCSNPNCRGIEMIFMDYQMPEMDGVQTTKLICEMANEGAIWPVNIVACTAFGGQDDIKIYQECLDAGMCDYAIKPINFENVSALVRKWVRAENL